MNEIKNQLPIVNIYLDESYTILSPIPIRTTKDAIALLSTKMYDLSEEQAFVIFSDPALMPICIANVGLGDQKGAAFSARDIVQTALLCNASFVTMIHNHPGYNSDRRHPGPSLEDIMVTDTIIKACSVVDVLVYDSVVVSGYKSVSAGPMVPIYYSIRERNYRRIKRRVGYKDKEVVPTKAEDLNWTPTPSKQQVLPQMEYQTASMDNQLQHQGLEALTFQEELEV